MEPWTWVVGYLLVLVVLQFVFTRVVRVSGSGGSDRGDRSDRDESRGRPSMSVPLRSGGDLASGSDPDDDGVGLGDDAPAGVTQCPRCGAENDRDAAYTYCWRCLERIR
ncbi:MAG: hypothetical protein ABEJ79_05510 [Halolamina sp.]